MSHLIVIYWLIQDILMMLLSRSHWPVQVSSRVIFVNYFMIEIHESLVKIFHGLWLCLLSLIHRVMSSYIVHIVRTLRCSLQSLIFNISTSMHCSHFILCGYRHLIYNRPINWIPEQLAPFSLMWSGHVALRT